MNYLQGTSSILSLLDRANIEKAIDVLAAVREKRGRLFILGLGGSAATASHAVNDFRKVCGIEAYAPTDNVAELTARINDDGFENCFIDWLKNIDLEPNDCVMVLSVGGGDMNRGVSMPIVNALKYASRVQCQIIGIVGRDGGYTKHAANTLITIPVVDSDCITPHTEEFHAIVLHCIVTELKVNQTKWEAVK
jgi:D-sedoheptulose 7-phosphate isomerase